MKKHQPLAWIVLALLVALLPRSGSAFEEPEESEKRAKKLEQKAKELASSCASDAAKKDKAKTLSRELHDELANDIKTTLAGIEDDDDAKAEDKANAKAAKAYLDASPRDIGKAIDEAGQITLEQIKTWKKRLVNANFAKTTTRIDQTCKEYCKASKDEPHIDMCAFSDLNLARVATSIDPTSVDEALASIDRIEKGNDDESESRLVGGGAALAFGLPALATAQGMTELAIRLATALGKLAIDRAKQEAVLWALDELSTRVCGNDGSDTTTTREIRTYWLPQLCSLTSEENLQSGFGAGQAMFSALVSAVENDAKGLPGAAAGLIAGHAYWTEDVADGKEPKRSAFDCTQTTSDECIRFKEVRLSTAKAIGGLLDGSDPVDEVRAWSTGIDELNRVDSTVEGSDVLAAPFAQLAACGLAVAAELGADDSRRTVRAPKEETIPQLYQVIAALASAPACWTLTGKGWESADYESKGTETLAIDRAGGRDIEKLSTVIRLGNSFKRTQTKAGDAWHKLAQVVARLRGARTRLSDAVKKASGPGEATAKVEAAVAKLDDAKLEPEDLRALLDHTKLDEAKDRLSSALDVAEELLAATDAAASLLEDVSGPSKIREDLFPGLLVSTKQKGCNADGKPGKPGERGFPAWACPTGKLHDEVEAFRRKLDDVQALIDALRDVLAGDWAAGSTKVLVSVEALVPRSTKRTPAVTTEIGEVIGLFTAILSAKDSDDIAVVLEKTASPPGSWRRKQTAGSFTLSLGSHVGVYAALESRWGQYGVNRERGKLHGQAPTLGVPIGFDFAWGTGRNSLGFFLPVIDPAAFVQYDVSEKGRLPGPRPLTVLSPGAFFRWGIFRTPITLLLGYTYRPRLRTWEATINEPGADAHQLGVSLAIDATFWNIVKR